MSLEVDSEWSFDIVLVCMVLNFNLSFIIVLCFSLSMYIEKKKKRFK